MEKIRGRCISCGEHIVLGEMTLWKDMNHYCAKCQIDLNRGLEHKEILRKRRAEILEQLHDINIELGVENNPAIM